MSPASRLPDPELLSSLIREVDDDASRTAVARAAEVLRRAVITGALPPGTRLPEEALAAQLEVSRNSLRAAFDELEVERLVVRRRHRGVSVPVPTAEDLQEIYRERLALEAVALRWPVPERRAAGVRGMTRALERGRRAREVQRVPAMAQANDDFHAAVVSLSGSERQAARMRVLQAEVRLVFHTLDRVVDFHTDWVERNAQLLALVEAGEDQQAAEAMAVYLQDSHRTILTLWEAGGADAA